MKNERIGKMVGVALLMALVVVMQSISGIIPAVGGFSISLVLIPIVLGSAVFGPGAGGLLGATFGAVVYINCVNGTDIGGAMVFQASPVLCFLVVMAKGILAGLASGGIYALVRHRLHKNQYLAMFLAAAVCPLVNTGFFVGCMLLFFKDVLASWAGGGDLLGYIFSGLLIANMLPELVINLAFSPAAVRITRIIQK